MKLIYPILLFMIFVNIFTFLFTALGIFPYEYTIVDEVYDEGMTGEDLIKDLSDISFDDITSLALNNVNPR